MLIWGGLVLALLGMLAYFAVSLFRKTIAAADELAILGDKLSILDARLDEIAPERKPSAVFQQAADLAGVVEENRIARGVARQSRRDARLERGKLLVSSAENWTQPHASEFFRMARTDHPRGRLAAFRRPQAPGAGSQPRPVDEDSQI